MIWGAVGGFYGILRMITGASIAFAVCAAIVIPLERRAARQQAELTFKAGAAQAKADELQRQVNGGNIVIAAYQEQLKNARAVQAADNEAAEKRIREYEDLRKTSGRSCAVDDIDRRFLLDLK